MGVQFAGNILVQANGGPLPISQGGTGQTTAPTAINALLPVQTGNSGKVLTTNGTNVSWSTSSGGGAPGGTDTQIQFNDSGTFGGSSNFVINKTTGALTAASTLTASGLLVNGEVETNRSIRLQTTGSNRWLLQVNGVAESGAAAGSDFELVAVADNGATQNVALSVSRATRVVDFKVAPTLNGDPYGTYTAGAGINISAGIISVGTLTSLTVTGSITKGGVEVGFLIIPQNQQNASYTCVLADSGKHIYTTTGGITWTIPSNASVPYPVGTAITFVNQSGSAVTIAIATDTMYLAGAGTTGSRTLGIYGMATALKVANTAWIISGTGVS